MHIGYVNSPSPNLLKAKVHTTQYVGSLLSFVLGVLVSSWMPPSLRAQNAYTQHNLVSDVSGLADQLDPNLKNPWGIAFSARGPFWIADNHTGLSTVYNSTGGIQTLVVNIPSPTGSQPPGAPTGLIFNSTTNFSVAPDAPSRFLFATEDGTIVAWSSGSNAVVKADNSASETIYKGLALGTRDGNDFLYAADFRGGKIDVFDANFVVVTNAGSFTDPGIQAGFAPFNIRNVGGSLYVTYAKQDADKEDDVPGAGNGFVDIYDTAGQFIKRFASGGTLNSPWGITMAPSSFDQFGGALLIGNFGDGYINAFDPVNGALLGQLNGTNGSPIAIQGLWDLTFGNGGQGGYANTLYFTAGIAGGGSLEDHGLFGSISPQNAYVQHNLVSDVSGLADQLDPNLANPWGLAFGASGPFWIADNHTGLSTVYNSTGGIQTLVVNIPPPTGSQPPGAPTGLIFNSTTNFSVAPDAPSHFLFVTENGTVVAWSSGTNAVVKADNSASETIYKGLTLGTRDGNDFLYAADFRGGKIDVFDANFVAVTNAGSFTDPGIPAGFAPFNIRNVGGSLYVTYAKQDEDKEDDVQGAGNGFVDIYDTAGQFIKRFASNGSLNSPWGITMAPSSFDQFGGALLIGNFGDGRINAFDPVTGALRGQLNGTNGSPIAIEGLWDLAFGNGGQGGDVTRLYFTAGIAAGGGLEDHGLFGSISTTGTPSLTINSIVRNGNSLTLTWSGGVAPYLVQRKTSLADTNWMNVVTTSNNTAMVVAEGNAGFFRVSDHAQSTLTQFTALLSGAAERPTPVTTTGTGLGTFSLEGTNLSYTISFSGLSGPAAAAHIHGPAPASGFTNVLIPFSVAASTSGTISGSAGLTADQITALKSGLLYANIHTAANGGGEIRGQIAPVQFIATLKGDNERPDPVTTTATGTGTFQLVGDQLTYNISFSGLSAAATAGHIHGPAPATGAADVLIPFSGVAGTSGNVTGTVTLPAVQLAAFIDGLTYANFHTSNHPGGEIRGQILPQ